MKINRRLLPVIESHKKRSFDLLSTGYSVMFSAIQLAHYMGAEEIILLIVDMNYSNGLDKSYFDKLTDLYFRAIDCNKHSKPAFEYYDDFLKSRGVKFINSKKGTIEDVTLKKHLDELFT